MKNLIYLIPILLIGCNANSDPFESSKKIDNSKENIDTVSKKADFIVVRSDELTHEIKWIKHGISIQLPINWTINSSIFGDTLQNKKTGELMPGLMTPKESTLNGREFINRFLNKGDIEFLETRFSMDGLPSKIMYTDSFQLSNANWYLGVSESDYEGDDYGTWYPYLYFGDFGAKKMLIQFYKYEFNPNDTIQLNRIVESIKILN